MTGLQLLVLALAVYRASYMVAVEEGPFSLFSWLRSKFDQSGKQETWYARGIYCPICISFWTGIIASIGFLLAPGATLVIALPLALSAFTLIAMKVFK
jgi:hypothetical protein